MLNKVISSALTFLLFPMATVLKTWRTSYFPSYKLCIVRCKSNLIFTGHRSTTKGNIYTTMSNSEYTYDKALTFESCEDCENLLPLFSNKFLDGVLKFMLAMMKPLPNPRSLSTQKTQDVILFQNNTMGLIYLR